MLLLFWFVVLLVGAAALGGSAVVGFLGHEPTIDGYGERRAGSTAPARSPS